MMIMPWPVILLSSARQLWGVHTCDFHFHSTRSLMLEISTIFTPRIHLAPYLCFTDSIKKALQ